MTVKEIAIAMDANEAWVRRYIHNDNQGQGGRTPRGVTWTEEWHTTYSKDYPSMESGVAKMRVYAPTRGYIVDCFIVARDKARDEEGS